MYFSTPISNITPALASVAMSRSDSRDSTSSIAYTSSRGYSAYEALAMSTSPQWNITSPPLIRSDSNTSSTASIRSSTSSISSVEMRRSSSSNNWMPSPYRSCLNTTSEEPSSYLSDDDLLYLPPDSLPVESIPALEPKKELTTEEQIAYFRGLQEKAEQQVQAQQQQQRRKTVRFEPAVAETAKKAPRRPSTVKRRTSSGRRGLSGPQ